MIPEGRTAQNDQNIQFNIPPLQEHSADEREIITPVVEPKQWAKRGWKNPNTLSSLHLKDANVRISGDIIMKQPSTSLWHFLVSAGKKNTQIQTETRKKTTKSVV